MSASVYTIGQGEQYPNSDSLAASLPVGAVVEFADGQIINNSKTLQARDGVVTGLTPVSPPPPPPPPPPPAVATPATIIVRASSGQGPSDGYRIPAKVTGSTIENLKFDTMSFSPSNTCSAVSDSGTKTTVNNIEQVGCGRVLSFNSAIDGVYDMLADFVGKTLDYNIWAGVDGSNPTGPSGCTLKRFNVLCKTGMHGLRVHKHTGCIFGDPVLCWPGQQWAAIINYMTTYTGAAFTLKEGADATAIRILIGGPLGLGPNNAEQGKPGWEALRTVNTKIIKCEVRPLDRYINLMPGSLDTLIQETKCTAAAGSACINLNGPWQAWPAATATIQDSVWECPSGTLLTKSSLPYIGNLKIVGGNTFNGKLFTKVNPDGTVS